MLDKNLDEAEDQYQIAMKNHMIHLDHLLDVQDSRLRDLKKEFDRNVFILEKEFDRVKFISRPHIGWELNLLLLLY